MVKIATVCMKFFILYSLNNFLYTSFKLLALPTISGSDLIPEVVICSLRLAPNYSQGIPSRINVTNASNDTLYFYTFLYCTSSYLLLTF